MILMILSTLFTSSFFVLKNDQVVGMFVLADPGQPLYGTYLRTGLGHVCRCGRLLGMEKREKGYRPDLLGFHHGTEIRVGSGRGGHHGPAFAVRV